MAKGIQYVLMGIKLMKGPWRKKLSVNVLFMYTQNQVMYLVAITITCSKKYKFLALAYIMYSLFVTNTVIILYIHESSLLVKLYHLYEMPLFSCLFKSKSGSDMR